MKKLSDCSCDGCIDLHVHSNASDGTLSPFEILLRASSSGLKAISITDHDTTKGCRVILEFGSIPGGMKFISGVEVSASPPAGFGVTGSVHVLGYGINPYDGDLSAYLKSLRTSRLHRAKEIIRKLASLGIILDKKELFAEAGDGVIGRPHFARLMVKRGFSTSFKDAFDRFLGQNKPAYVEKKKVEISDVILLIRNAGGVAVLAHPYLLGLKNLDVFKKFVILLKSMGLSGLEAIYPEHPKYVVDFYTSLCRSNDLIVTGGTDFHGDNSSGLNLGIGRGNFFVPFIVYQNLLRLVDGIL